MCHDIPLKMLHNNTNLYDVTHKSHLKWLKKNQILINLIGLSVKFHMDVDRVWDVSDMQKKKERHFFSACLHKVLKRIRIYDTFTDPLPRMCVICIRDFQVSSRQWSSKMRILSLQLTKFIAHCPGLIIVKMNISLSVRPWEKSMSQDPTRAIKGQIITMPVPNIGCIAII